MSPIQGYTLGMGTVLTGLILDKQQNIEYFPSALDLHSGLTLSIVNLLVIGPFVHSRVTGVCRETKILRKVTDTFIIVIAHSGLYSLAHRAMHKIVALRPFHKDHHKYVTQVIPSMANSVSFQEFMFAYMLPFILTTLLLHPSQISLNIAVSVVSFANLLVHSPNLKEKKWPIFLVPPQEHLDHHETKKCFYSAPTINWNFILK